MAALTRRTSRRRSCDGKQPYPNRTAAEDAMFTMLRTRGGSPQLMHAYKCKVCTRAGRPAVYHYGHRRGATWSR